MLKKKTIGIAVCMTVICTATAGVLIYRNPNKKSTLEDDILKVEEALGDEYKKQSETTLAATLTYGSKDDKTKIYYHILKMDYYEQSASEITGLNTVAFGVLFPVKFMDSCEEMKIQEGRRHSIRKAKWRKVQKRGIRRDVCNDMKIISIWSCNNQSSSSICFMPCL